MPTGLNLNDMYWHKPAPWEDYPKFLTFSEIQDPLGVLQDFYGVDWPQGQLLQLKEWCNLVISTKHYENKIFGSGHLLYIYELNVKLLEGLYLLLLANLNVVPRPEKISDEQLNQEKEEWYWFPDNLTKEELADPFIPVKAAFKKIKLQQYRECLSEWIYAAFSYEPIDEYASTADVVLVFKHLKKLYAAAWLINQRHRENPVLKQKYREKNKTYPGNDAPEDDQEAGRDIITKAKPSTNAPNSG
jgi:hypothetical protein